MPVLKKHLLFVPALIVGLALAGCTPDAPVPSSAPPVDVYNTVDILTPSTDQYSREYDVAAKLAEIETNSRKVDFCVNYIQKVGIDHFTDGDTLTVKYVCNGENKNQAVRFFGVDTPETHHPEKGTEPWGMAAAQFTRRTVQAAIDAGKDIILQGGRTGVGSTYDRITGYLWVDGILLNSQLVEIGLGTYGCQNEDQEIHDDAIFAAKNYRIPKNGYRSQFKDHAMEHDDPNWDYSVSQSSCGSAAVESNVCVKDKSYQYDFQKVGPSVAVS